MDLCVIGNSHVAALQQAGAVDSASVTYFAARARGIESLELRGDRLITHDPEVAKTMRLTSGGDDAIPLPSFDAFALVGLSGLAPLLRSWPAHRTYADAVDDEAPLISEACFGELVRAELEASAGLAMFDKIRAVTDRPVVLVSTPLPAAGVHELHSVGAIWVAEPRFVRHARAVLEQAYDALPLPVARQPAATIVEDIYTAPQFARDSLFFLDERRRLNDYAHMNGDFGRIMWGEILAPLLN